MTQYIIRFNIKSIDQRRKKYSVFETDSYGHERLLGTRNLIAISALGSDHTFFIDKHSFVIPGVLESLVDFLDRRHKRYSFC